MRRNGIQQSSKVKRIVARLRVEDIGYALVESRVGDSKHECEL